MNPEMKWLAATNQTVVPAVGDWQVLRPATSHDPANEAFVRFEHYAILAWLIEVTDLHEEGFQSEPSVTTHPITTYGVTLEPYGIKDGYGRIYGAHQFTSFDSEADLLKAMNLPIRLQTRSKDEIEIVRPA
jgi:hypothetical protein